MPRCASRVAASRPLTRRRQSRRVPRTRPLLEALSAVSAAAWLSPAPGLATGALANSLVFALGLPVLLKGLTPAGVVHAWFFGTLAYAAFGLGAYLLVCIYFVVGSACTKLKLAQKQAEGIAEARAGRRGPASVWGSGLAGAVCAVIALLDSPGDEIWRLAFVASFASKLGDTASSEIGKAYGRTTFLITTMRPVPRGTDGALSLEGTLGGIGAAALLAGLSLAMGQITARGALVATAAAFAANIAESFLGATAQGRAPWLTNDVVNILQILMAATLAVVLGA